MILAIIPNFKVGYGPSNSFLFIKYLPVKSIILYTLDKEMPVYFSDEKNVKVIYNASLNRIAHHVLSQIIADLANKYIFEYIISIGPEYLLHLPQKMLDKTLVIPQGFLESPHVRLEPDHLLNMGFFLSRLETYQLSKNVGAVGAISRYMYNEIYRRLRPKKIALLYNPIKIEFFTNARALDMREQNKELRLLYVGKLKKLKGVDKLLLFMPEVLREFRNTHLDLVGDGPLEGALEKMVNKMKLNKYVKVHGRVTDNQLLYLYSKATILVNPSYWESFSLPVAEAAAMGIPSVVRAVYALKEHVEFGYAEGFRKDDPHEFTAAIGRVLDNYEKLSERGLNVARALYHPLKVAERVMKVLKELN